MAAVRKPPFPGRRWVSQGYRLARAWSNRIASSVGRPYSRVYFISDRGRWVIDRIGAALAREFRRGDAFGFHLTPYHYGIRRQVVHFGSETMFLGQGLEGLDRSNQVVMTWFHGEETNPDPVVRERIARLPAAMPQVQTVVASSSIGARRLLGWGVPHDKIVVVPLGVDLGHFRPPAPGQREAVRRELGIPEDSVCIGSFQKDGVGWGQGMEPKLVKGPDVFLETAAALAKTCPVFVLLTGPARGYVKRGLAQRGIPYLHRYLARPEDLVRYYHALDLYLVTSRDEGGPMSILESMATGVPLVSTQVGMAPDVVRHGENGLLCPVEDVGALAGAASDLLRQPELRRRFAAAGVETAQAYGWERIARRYAEEVYRPLLSLSPRTSPPLTEEE